MCDPLAQDTVNSGEDYVTALVKQIYAMKRRWDDYKELYYNETYVERMNSAAPVYFRGHQNDVIDLTMLAICRLTDPKRQGKSRNISIMGLPDCLVDEDTKGKAATIAVNELDERIELKRMRDWRNKEGAHNDELALTGKAVPARELPYFEDIEYALSQIIRIASDAFEQENIVPYVKGFERGNWHLMELIKLGLQKAQETDDIHFDYPESSEMGSAE